MQLNKEADRIVFALLYCQYFSECMQTERCKCKSSVLNKDNSLHLPRLTTFQWKTSPYISHGWQNFSERQFPTSPTADNISVKDNSLHLPRLTTFQWKTIPYISHGWQHFSERQVPTSPTADNISVKDTHNSLIFATILSLILYVRVRTVIFCIFLETRSSVNVKISHGGLSQVSLKYQGR